MAGQLLTCAKIDFDQSSQLEQALVETFLFGMISADGMTSGLTQPQVHALSLLVFCDSLHYTQQAAAQAVQECINATTPSYHETMNAILHRGIDGHYQYINGDISGLSENIRLVLDSFRGSA